MNRRHILGSIIALFLVLIPLGAIMTLDAPAEWKPAKHLSTGFQPHGLCVADLDNNGYLDIVVANYFSNNVTIYYNDIGGFGSPQTLSVAGGPEAVAVGDVVGDNNMDIVVVRKTDKKISAFPGTGTGFGSATEKTCGPDPVHLAVGDLDGDGDDDIAVAETGGLVRFFYNTGASLLNTLNLTTDSGTRKVVIEDLEGDADNDIVAINENWNNLTIYRRTGASWGSPTKLLTGSKPTGLAVGNIKGDIHKDLVICNYNENNVTVYEWDGSGGVWAAPYTLDVGFNPNDVYIADANNDGTKDIITADLGVSTITVIPNEGTGWGTKISENVGNEPYAIVVEDLDKDTKKDIVTVNGAGGDLTILYWIDNSPPVAYGIPDTYSIYEDTPSNGTFIDLWQYFEDAETSDNLLQFSVVNGSDTILIGSIESDRYFTLDIGPDGENWYGKRNFTVRCVDQKLDYVEDEFQVTVDSVNDKPKLVSIGGKDILTQDLMLTSVGFYAVEDQWYNRSLVCTDADNDTLTFKTNISEGSPNPHPRFGIDDETGSIAFLPTNDDALVGALYFNLSVTDGKGGTSFVRVTLGIQNVNDDPVIYPIGDPDGTLVAYENIPYNYPVKGEDIDGDSITWHDDCDLFDITAAGNISLKPMTADIGVHKFNISANDGNGGIAVKPVTLTIANVNDPPEIPRMLKPASEAKFYVNEIINFSAMDCFDPDLVFGDSITYQWDFGDGQSATGQNQTHQYTSEGDYAVELKVMDSGSLSRSINVTIHIQGEGEVPSSSQTDHDFDDSENDVNFFTKGKKTNSIGADENIDIDMMTTKRVGMNLEIVLRLIGVYSPDVNYEVYVSAQFKEDTYQYTGSGPLPEPSTPVIVYLKGAYCENQNISEGSPEVLGVKNIKFTLPLSELIGKDDFYFFGIAYYLDNDTFTVDSVGNGALDPQPIQPPPDDDDDDQESPLRKILIIILFIVLAILFIFLVVWIVMKIREKGKKEEEKDEHDAGARHPPAGAAPPPPPEAQMPPPPMMEDEGELIPPDVPPPMDLMGGEEEPPPDMIEPEPVPVEPDRPVVPIGATAHDAFDGLLLPPPDSPGGARAREPEPEPAPAKKAKSDKDDIFDELFTPIGDGGGGAAGGMEVECYQCHGTINVTSDERPLVLKCPHCGTESMLP